MSLSVYSGEDRLDAKDEWGDHRDDNGYGEYDIYKNSFHWGNFNAALDWNYQFSPKLFANFTAFYTHNRSSVSSSDEWTVRRSDGKDQLTTASHGYRSAIDDIGYRAAFDFRPTPRHHILFGQEYTYHRFQPQTFNRFDGYQDGREEKGDTIAIHSHNKNIAHQVTLYAEDEMTLNERWSVNGGLNVDLFSISGKTFSTLSPRLSMKYQPPTACRSRPATPL